LLPIIAMNQETR